MSFAPSKDCCVQMTKTLMGYIEHAQDQFFTYMENFAKKIGVQPYPVPRMFPFPMMQNAPFDAALDDPQSSSDYPPSS